MRGVTANLDNEKLFRIVLAFAFLILVLFVVESYRPTQSTRPIAESGIEEFIFSNKSHSAIARKILALPEDEDGLVNREGATCSKANIDVFQGATDPLPNGIPTYTVVIENVCISSGSGSCIISDIHMSCGWFSSARLINPSIFRRICYNDCLVNNGDPISPGQTISFQYANSFQYPLYVSSVACN